MEFLLQYTALVEFEPAESLLFSFLVEADPLSTARIQDSCPVDRILLVSVQMSRREKLEVSRNRRFSDMGLLSEVAFEPFDRIVSEKYLHITLPRQFLSGQRVLFRTEPRTETHACHVDHLTPDMEHLRGWPRVLQEVDVSRLGVYG